MVSNSSEETRFLSECPAWARVRGINTLKLWEITKEIVPFDWPTRFDVLDYYEAVEGLLPEEKKIICKVLEGWDEGLGGIDL